MGGMVGHRRDVESPGEHRSVPRWRFAAAFVIVSGIYFGLSALSGDKNALRHTVIWLLTVCVAAGVLWLWKRLPTRVRSEPPRYTRDELVRSIFEAFFVFSVAYLPYPIRDGPTAKTWIVGPILLLGMSGAWLFWVLPAERRREAERRAFMERLRRPEPTAKVR